MADPGKKPRIFLSHGHDDREFAAKLSEAIGDVFLGAVEVFRADALLRAGAPWIESILEAIRSSRVVVAILSRASTNQPWVYFETGHAIGVSVPVVVVCVGISRSECPAPLNSVQTFDGLSRESLHSLFTTIAHRCDLELTLDRLTHEKFYSLLQLDFIPNEELLRRVARDRDATAFDVLYERLYPGIVRDARRWCPDVRNAEEIAADVMLHVWERADRIPADEPERFRAYVQFLTRQKARNILRREAPKVTKASPGDWRAWLHSLRPPTGQAEWDDQLKHIASAVESLGESERAIITLRFSAGLTYMEIARILGMSIGAVQSQTSRALRKLEQDLTQERAG